MDFSAWLRRWLSGHPLREPSTRHMSRYTADVMAKVKGLEQRAPAAAVRSAWLAWPRLALACACAAALVLVVWIRREPSATLLAELEDEAALDLYAADDLDDLEAELQTEDLLLLAEAPPDDATWVEQTVQLLNDLDEELPEDGTAGGTSDQEWLNELEMLDEDDLSASS